MSKVLYNIRSELDRLETRDVTLERCVQKRLSKSVLVHALELDKICKYLNYRDPVKVLKQIDKFNKKKSKKEAIVNEVKWRTF